MIKVDDYLQNLQEEGFRFYFRPNGGNAGDSLINAGCIALLSNLGIAFDLIYDPIDVLQLGDRDVLIMSGGGYLVPYWTGGSEFLMQIKSRKCRLLLMPQSILKCETILHTLSHGDAIFLRGETSYLYAQSLNLEAMVSMSDDCAFYANVSEILHYRPRWPRTVKEVARYGLIAYHCARSRIFSGVYAYRTDGEKNRSGRASLINDISLICKFGHRDINDIMTSAHWLLRLLSWYDEVATDRLHVMIGRILIEKHVDVVPNDYFKIVEVIDLSVRSYENRSSFLSFHG